MVRAVVVCLLAAVTATGSVCAVPVPVLTAGDTNGDHAIDILDLQRLIMQVLHGEGDTRRADVNCDGRVDILDFQRMLDQAQTADKSPAPSPNDNPRLEAISVARGLEPATPAEAALDPLITPGKRVTTAALRARSVPRHIRLPKVERYTQKLTPNAPPCLLETPAAGW